MVQVGGVVHAQVSGQWRVVRALSYTQFNPKWDCGLRRIATDAFIHHRSVTSKQRKAAATILVDYDDDVPIDARAAFERAVAIWEAHISSPVTIRVDVRFEEFRDEVLAGAGPTLAVVDTSGNGRGDIILGAPLLDARRGTDQFPNESDIQVAFSSRWEDWHYGPGPAPAKTVDFTTVALHEIGHGLNYVGLFDIEGIPGVYGADFNMNGRIDEDERFAGAFGRHLVEEQNDGSFLSLTNSRTFGNPSKELADALRSDRVFFKGRKARLEAGGSDGPSLPKIYAPEQFVRGSSISHLDEEAYPAETTNALMTPRIQQAETIRLPGPITCAQLIDMGWEPGPGCTLGSLVLSAAKGDVKEGQSGERREVRLSWELRGRANEAASVRTFVVEQKRYSDTKAPEPFERRATIVADGAQEYSLTLDDVRVGTHTFRISTAEGRAVPVTTTVAVEAERPSISVYPNPFEETAQISFVLPQRQRVRVEVFDALGRRVATPFEGERPAHTAQSVTFDAREFTNSAGGVYFFRVTGKGFSTVEKAVHIQ